MTIVGRGFGPMAQAISKSLGGRELPLAEYPGVIATESDATLREKVQASVVEQVIKGLCGPDECAAAVAPTDDIYQPREIVISDTLGGIQEHFYERMWSDGLPVIPPTIALVEEFLRHTDRAPEEVIGVLKPEEREATVWNVAVNGVMAGCRPEYMPILLAAVEAIADPEFRIQDAGSTPGWEPLVVVSGPISRELDFNSGTGAMRVGRRANTSIGRFLRLYMRNVAGLRIPPGKTDKGTIAFTFNVAMAENEEAVRRFGWPTFGADRGFRPDENVVTVQSVVAISAPIYLGGEVSDILRTIVEAWGKGDLAYWVHTGYLFGHWHPLLVMSPSIAEVFARSGWSKNDIRKHLSEYSRASIAQLEDYAHQGGATAFSLIANGTASGILRAAPEDGMVSTIPRPEWLGILVAGDPDRNQMRGYTQNQEMGVPVSKRVVLPAAWQRFTLDGS